MAVPLIAHPFSYSTAKLTIAGQIGAYEFEVPLHDVQALPDPSTEIRKHVAFRIGDQPVEFQDFRCLAEGDTYRCSARIAVPSSFDVIEARAELATLFGPEHIHHVLVTRGSSRADSFFQKSTPPRKLNLGPKGAHGPSWPAVVLWVSLVPLALVARPARQGGMAFVLLAAGAVAGNYIPWPSLLFREVAMLLCAAGIAGEGLVRGWTTIVAAAALLLGLLTGWQGGLWLIGAGLLIALAQWLPAQAVKWSLRSAAAVGVALGILLLLR